jgi:hypothetical protein
MRILTEHTYTVRVTSDTRYWVVSRQRRDADLLFQPCDTRSTGESMVWMHATLYSGHWPRVAALYDDHGRLLMRSPGWCPVTYESERCDLLEGHAGHHQDRTLARSWYVASDLTPV